MFCPGLPSRPQLYVPADRREIKLSSTSSDRCAETSAIHATVSDRHREIAVDSAAHGAHREIRVKLARQVERDIAAHALEREVAAARELLDADFDVAAHGIRVD